MIKNKSVTIHWLIREQDLHYIPQSLRKKVQLEEGEHIMWDTPETNRWDEFMETFIQVVYVKEGERPVGELNGNLWWWTKRYDHEEQRVA